MFCIRCEQNGESLVVPMEHKFTELTGSLRKLDVQRVLHPLTSRILSSEVGLYGRDHLLGCSISFRSTSESSRFNFFLVAPLFFEQRSLGHCPEQGGLVVHHPGTKESLAQKNGGTCRRRPFVYQIGGIAH